MYNDCNSCGTQALSCGCGSNASPRIIREAPRRNCNSEPFNNSVASDNSDCGCFDAAPINTSCCPGCGSAYNTATLDYLIAGIMTPLCTCPR